MLTDADLIHYERVNRQRSKRLAYYVGSTVLFMCFMAALLLTLVVLSAIKVQDVAQTWLGGGMGYTAYNIVKEMWLRRKEITVLHALTEQQRGDSA